MSPKATTSAARPSSGTSGGLRLGVRSVLRRALGHERIPLRDEEPVLELASHRDVASRGEEVGDGTGVDDRDGPGSVDVAESEAQAALMGIPPQGRKHDAGQADRAGMRRELARVQGRRGAAHQARVEQYYC